MDPSDDSSHQMMRVSDDQNFDEYHHLESSRMIQLLSNLIVVYPHPPFVAFSIWLDDF